RHADRVADAVLEQGADADAALDPAILAVAGLGDTHVERVARRRERSRRRARPARGALLEARRQQAVGMDRPLGVARLHGEDDVAVALVLADVEELERAL